jgi:cyclase
MQAITSSIFAETDRRGCNPGYVVTSDGVVVIDTPQLPTRALFMHEQALKAGPIRFLINTEHHVDHIFGNYFFTSAEHILAHVECDKMFMVKTPELNPYEYAKEAIPTDDPAGESLFPDEAAYVKAMNRPDIRISGDSELHVGNHTFQLLYTPGHTSGQLSVYIPEEKVLFASDTVFHNCQTWLYASDIAGWITSLERLMELDIDIVIPGHGPVCTRQELYVQRSFLQEWETAVSLAVAEGWSRERCLAEISFLDRFPVDIGQEYMGEKVTKLNVGALYDKLIGRKK